MKLTAREDITAPIAQVYNQLIDARALENGILRRGGDMRRSGNANILVQGEELSTRFGFRGRKRDVTAVMRELRAPEHIVIDARSGGMEIVSVLNLVALSPHQTRIDMSTNLKPKTLSARLLVQSLKLTRGTVDRRLRRRFRELAKIIETRANT